MKGPAFTWNNNRKGSALIRIRLDRALSNHNWRTTYCNAAVIVKQTVGSDHLALVIDTEGGAFRGQRPFLFESMWFNHRSEHEVYQEILDHFNTAFTSEGVNDAALKQVQQPESTDQYRPIALCAVLLQVITKISANRLKMVLEDIVAPTQSAFIPNRSISDNSFIAYELFNYMGKRKKGQKKDKWVNLIMASVSLVNYKFLINGATQGAIQPTRGIRQGDPLSPALFIICSQALNSTLTQAKSSGSIHGVRVRNQSQPVTHLLFANDLLIFSEVRVAEIFTLKDTLDIYCRASGQAINLKKSTMIFNSNTPLKLKKCFSRILKVPYGVGPKKYLGLPTQFGVSKADLFKDISEKVTKKFEG
ncbi:uncharacterized protein LOC122665844 [Telopea speciosissima]|uniref:uncharacterized protein LOC122665844 n=1 Tax=Telopea speciosissima TaxID=54955 RepID=UPI001CC6FC95|nr:uncharacterized protein LOC122665844 [Telopea speciosissima]